MVAGRFTINMKGIAMTEDMMVAMVKPNEEQEAFAEKIIAVLQETRELGPMIHTAIMAQVIGRICGSNPSWSVEDAARTAVMNIHHGYLNMIHDFMEQSAESKLN